MATKRGFPKEARDKNRAKKKQKDDFELQMVLDLGGAKKDFAMLQELEDDDKEDMLIAKDDEMDDAAIKRDEILDFIKELDIIKYRDEQSQKTQEEAPVREATPPSQEEASTSKEKGKKKKTGKNKFKIQHDEVSSTSSPNMHRKETTATYVPRKYLLIKSGGHWYNNEFPKDPTTYEPVSDSEAAKLRQFGAKVFEDDVHLYSRRKDASRSSDSVWLRKVISSGTLSDKVAGLTVQIQDDTIHNLNCLDTLIGMVSTKGKRECLVALDTLKELFLGDLLPFRKLKKFEQHPLGDIESLSSGNKDSRDKRLLMWYFEDQLKESYKAFVNALEEISHDTLPATKKRAINVIFDLLKNRSEQDKVLLSTLINKLGDPDHKIATKVAHLLTRLVEKKPIMKRSVVLEIERVLYRSNVSPRAQYYAICFLNQLMLSQYENDLATRLIGIYFSFFKSFVKKGEVDSKMMSALLSGVNRSYPYTKDKEKVAEQMNTLYKVVHIVNFNTSVQALMLLHQVMDTNQNLTDRYYVTLYRKLVDPELRHSSKQAMFLNLLFKSLQKDSAEKRIKAFLKRLIQVCNYQTPPFICAALIVFSEVLKSKPGILNVSQFAEDSDDDEEHFIDLEDDEAEDKGEETTENRYDSKPKHLAKSGSSVNSASWVHRRNFDVKATTHVYDPHHRNPLYCHAEQECIWELQKLSSHYHPTVSLFANTILKGQQITYQGDPLQDFSLIRFLDRFVYRNPKKKSVEQGEDGRVISLAVQSKRKQYTAMGARAIPVNSDQYIQMAEEKIPIDERFFYRFFQQKSRKQDDESGSDVESVDDDEFDEYLEGYEKQFGDDQDFKFDFAGEFSTKKDRKSKSHAMEFDEDEDFEDDLSDEEVDFEDMDFGGEIGSGNVLEEEGAPEFDEENIAFSDNDMDEMNLPTKGKRKGKMGDDFAGPSAKKGKKNDLTNLFAAAEEFSHLIDETADANIDMGGTDAMSNLKDKASAEQLKWEQNREKWIKGEDWKTRKRNQGKSKGKPRRPPGKFGKHKGKAGKGKR